MKYIEKLPNWLRWIVAPLACYLAMSVVIAAIHWLFLLSGAHEGSLAANIGDYVVAGGVSGYTAVFVGAMVAPSYRKIVSLVIGGGVVMFSGILLSIALKNHEWWPTAMLFAAVVGVGMAIHSIFDDEEAKARWASLEAADERSSQDPRRL